MSYEPGQPPVLENMLDSSEEGRLLEFVLDELRKISENLAEVDEVRLVMLNVEPVRPRDGMVVLVDGTNFNPGAGAGFYGRSAGSWVKLG